MVIIGIREEQKKITKQRIIDSTKQLLLINGFVKVSSKEISKAAQVSQGSIFLHFETKDFLLEHIISESIHKFLDELDEYCDPKTRQDKFLSDLLDVLSRNEDMLSRIYKDYFYLSEHLVKGVEKAEKKIKDYIFNNIRKNSMKSMSIIDSFISIDAFYSQVRVNLTQKEVYSQANSVIRQSRGKLTKLYKNLFQ